MLTTHHRTFAACLSLALGIAVTLVIAARPETSAAADPVLPAGIQVRYDHQSDGWRTTAVMNPSGKLTVTVTPDSASPVRLGRFITYLKRQVQDLPTDTSVPATVTLKAPIASVEFESFVKASGATVLMKENVVRWSSGKRAFFQMEPGVEQSVPLERVLKGMQRPERQDGRLLGVLSFTGSVNRAAAQRLFADPRVLAVDTSGYFARREVARTLSSSEADISVSPSSSLSAAAARVGLVRDPRQD